MADLEAELARFEAELAEAEAAAPAPSMPPPVLRSPGNMPPPAAALQAPSAGPAASHAPFTGPPPAARPAPAYSAPGPSAWHQAGAPSAPYQPQPGPSYMPPPPAYAGHAYPPQQHANPGYYPPAQAYAPQPAIDPATIAARGAGYAQQLAYAGLASHIASTDSGRSELLAGVKAALEKEKPGKKAKIGIAREAGGERWIDPTLLEWPENDFRIFVGNLGNETNDDVLTKAFNRFPSFNKAKVIRDKKTNKSRGYGFASFQDAVEGAKALREMDGKYVGNRPCQLRKSNYEDRTQTEQRFLGGRGKGRGGNRGRSGPTGRYKNHIGGKVIGILNK